MAGAYARASHLSTRGGGCDAIVFEDVDGAANGAYASASLPFVEADELELLVALEPLP
jgi:hypothetical protein